MPLRSHSRLRPHSRIPRPIRTKIHQACFAVIAIAVAIMVITSCASPELAQRTQPPTPDVEGSTPPAPSRAEGAGAAQPSPFILGEEVQAPYGCLELRARGGEC